MTLPDFFLDFEKRIQLGLHHKGPSLNGMLGYLWAVFATHVLLRMCLLLRSDAYGLPLVGKADWYLPHAFCIDLLWIFGYSTPLLVLASLSHRLRHSIWIFLITLHSGLLIATVIDQETLRFLGMHLDLSLLGTYGNSASIREVLRFVNDDRSIRYLPYLLFFGCIPLSLLLFYTFQKNIRWMRASHLSVRAVAIAAIACGISWLYVNVIWTGGFRMLKLRPFITTLIETNSRKPTTALSQNEVYALSQTWQQVWTQSQGDSSWLFPNPQYPYYRVPITEACKHLGENQGVENRASIAPSLLSYLVRACNTDQDGDGYPLKQDCDDANPQIHPGALDIPGDGLDQDCNGGDEKPWNIVMIIMESHRGVNVGHLQPYGASAAATPILDSIANKNRYWSRFSVSGIPTINALMAIHLSIVQHPLRYVASDFTTLSNRGFPALLAERGWKTHFFSAADPAWDSQTPWLRQWYQGISYDRFRETDAKMFHHMGQWMRDSLNSKKPFLMTAMTKTNHYPFNAVEGMPQAIGESLTQKMQATMHYTDACVGEFLQSLRNEPWFSHTLFIFLGDHGFPLGEHGSSTIGHGLYKESTWIPFVIAGAHPRLPLAGPQNEIGSQVDIGPTVLDLAGLEIPNSFMGHSLLRPHRERGLQFVLRGEQGLLEEGDWRIHGALDRLPREQGDEVFSVSTDPLEKTNLIHSRPNEDENSMQFLKSITRLHIWAIENNRIWPGPTFNQ